MPRRSKKHSPIRIPPGEAETAPATSGAYTLLIELDRPVRIDLPGKPRTTLPPGTYLYAGSARGPGGMRARLARHFRKNKKMHWHADLITSRAAHVSAVAVEGGSECALLQEQLARSGTSVPIPGFGSSDCKTCPAHLVKIS